VTRAGHGELRLRVLGELRRGNGSVNGIREALDIRSRRTVTITLERLAADGLVGTDDAASWSLTKKGQTYLSELETWIGGMA
jgi:Mn-dependent DtxR family transcriptional regulator